MTAYDPKNMRKDCVAAFNAATPYHNELREIYRYFMPWREPTSERSPEGGTKTAGAKRTDHLFDGTGMTAAANFVANMQADWMPEFDQIFKYECGPLWVTNDRDDRNRDLQAVGDLVHALLGPVRGAANEMFYDLFAGTGAMFIGKGSLDREPIRAAAVPPVELAIVNGPWNDAERIFWKRTYLARHIPERWPKAELPRTLTDRIKSAPDTPVTVVQYTYWDEAASRWKLAVWSELDDGLLFEEEFRTNPWVTPRLFLAPGESHGRGLAHLALPFVKTLNKTRELQLRAAGIALLGIWMYRNDGVFNPKTAKMQAGAFLKVGFADGPLKTISRLPSPQDFDISSIVMADEREQARRASLDDELPEMADRVRSPTEIAGRMRRYDRNRGGSTVRLAREMILPIARRSVDIVEQLGLLPTTLDIDQVLTRATATSPAAAAQHVGKVDRAVSWMQMVIGLLGPQAVAMTAEVERLVPDLARWMGMEEKYLRNKAGIEEFKGMVAQMVAQQKLAEEEAADTKAGAGNGAPVVPQVRPDSIYMNGGV